MSKLELTVLLKLSIVQSHKTHAISAHQASAAKAVSFGGELHWALLRAEQVEAMGQIATRHQPTRNRVVTNCIIH